MKSYYERLNEFQVSLQSLYRAAVSDQTKLVVKIVWKKKKKKKLDTYTLTWARDIAKFYQCNPYDFRAKTWRNGYDRRGIKSAVRRQRYIDERVIRVNELNEFYLIACRYIDRYMLNTILALLIGFVGVFWRSWSYYVTRLFVLVESFYDCQIDFPCF